LISSRFIERNTRLGVSAIHRAVPNPTERGRVVELLERAGMLDDGAFLRLLAGTGEQ
jgi:hypothetical protein